MQILIVEDLIDLSRELKENLRGLPGDLVIMISPSAEEGILEVGRHEVDLLVTDFRLPGISGLELVRRVRKKNPKVKVILTSAIVDAQFKQEAEELHVDQVLQKPVDVKAFRQAVAISLGIEPGTLPESAKTPPPPVKAEPQEEKKEKVEDGLSKTLIKIHQSLQANCTLWMTGEGEVEKAFGELPADLPRDVIRNCARTASSAHLSLSKLLLSPQKGSIHYQAGMGADLLFANTGEWVLMTVLHQGIAPADLEKKVGLLLAGISEIGQIVKTQTGAGNSETLAEKNKAAAGAGDQELAKLLGAPGKVSSKAADDFWEEASTSAKPDLGNPDLLDYEQAKKLGFKIKKEDKPG
jgi:CheY-like chemotaxis protein